MSKVSTDEKREVRANVAGFLAMKWLEIDHDDIKELYQYTKGLLPFVAQIVGSTAWKDIVNSLDRLESECEEIVKKLRSKDDGMLESERLNNAESYVRAVDLYYAFVCKLFIEMKKENVNFIKEFIPRATELQEMF